LLCFTTYYITELEETLMWLFGLQTLKLAENNMTIIRVKLLNAETTLREKNNITNNGVLKLRLKIENALVKFPD